MGKLGVSVFPVTVCVVLPDVKQRCVKFTVAAVICLLLLLLVAGVLLAYYCECRIYPHCNNSRYNLLREVNLECTQQYNHADFPHTPALPFLCLLLPPSFLALCSRDAVWRRELCVGVPVVRRGDGLSCGPG